jgi:hypothetical protein
MGTYWWVSYLHVRYRLYKSRSTVGKVGQWGERETGTVQYITCARWLRTKRFHDSREVCLGDSWLMRCEDDGPGRWKLVLPHFGGDDSIDT